MSVHDSLSAIQDFRLARLKADAEAVIARLTGQSGELLSYDEVRQKLRGVETQRAVLKEIPLENVVGSVGRQQDFTRGFLPKRGTDEERWARVKALMISQRGLPPIEVYQLGEVYFVKDGNHRVSVARDMGLTFIEAYVTKVQVSVPVTSDIDADALIIQAEYTDFLEKTQLRKLRPEADLSVSIPGQYEKLLEHIEVHRYFMGLDEQRDVNFEEAVTHWYDAVYLPVVTLIRERGLLQLFPERTLTDLYLWLGQYRADLETSLGWALPATNIAQRLSDALERRPRSDLVEELTPETYLAEDILVAIPGTEVGWCALEQALNLYSHEPSRIYGLHVVPTVAQLNSEATDAIRQTFEERCASARVTAQFAVQMGNPTQVLCGRARWVDVVVANLAHPPGENRGLRLSRGFGTLLRRCPRPILAVPDQTTELRRPLLAYDGSVKANMALFAAAHLALRWGASLEVISVSERGAAGIAHLGQARRYLEQHGVSATYLHERGEVVPTLLEVASTRSSDLLVIGSYEHSALLEPLLGGVLDEVLRASRLPMLICQ